MIACLNFGNKIDIKNIFLKSLEDSLDNIGNYWLKWFYNRGRKNKNKSAEIFSPSIFDCITNTTGYARGSKKLVAMNRKKEPPMIK